MAHRVRGGTDRCASRVVIVEHELLHPVEHLDEALRQKMRSQLRDHVKVTNACRKLALCSCSNSNSALADVSRCVRIRRVEMMRAVEGDQRLCQRWDASWISASQKVSIDARLV